MATQVEKIVETYRTLAKIPALISAEIYKNGLIRSVWSQRNLERGKTTKFAKIQQISGPPISIDVSNELLNKTSPSEKFRAVLRDIDNKQYLEIWDNTSIVNNVDLSALEVHGNVYTDGEFASFEWSPDEKKLLFVAEEKLPKSEPFYKRKPKKDKEIDPKSEDTAKGEEYLFKQDWGEQLVGKKQSVLVEYILASDTIKILEGVPKGICPAQPTYSPDGSYVVGVAYKTHPRKLGLIYCSNRPSSIFKLDFNGGYVEITNSNNSVKSPRFTPDGKILIWLQRAAGGPHASAMSLVKVKVPFSENPNPDVVVDTVKTVVDINMGQFYGLYNTTFPARCWASDNRLLLSTVQKNQIKSFIVDIDTGNITELVFNEGSQIVLDVQGDKALVNRRNFLLPDILSCLEVPPKGKESTLPCLNISDRLLLEQFTNFTYHYFDLSHNNNDSVKSFSTIYVGPKSGSEKQTPLIVFPHGGPHSASVNNFSMEVSLFVSLGFAVLLINYRGSLGAGQDSVEFLPGRIGTSDVADCILAVNESLSKFPWLDTDRVALCGGSHGGFLVTHLSGQYPEKFKVVVARNPVIDVASMSITSDIPDWCYVEAGDEYTQVGELNSELLLQMRKVSPIQHAHKVKAPTLLQVGSKDLRVPPAQATEHYHRLKANGTEVRMNLYDDNHPIGSVSNEIDNLINSILWITQHMNVQLP